MQDAASIFQRIERAEFVELDALVGSMLERIQAKSIEENSGPVAQLHPLGFLYLRWELGNGRSLRLHVWDKDFECAQTPNWPIHDHIFSFRSLVLAGAVQNKVYQLIPADKGRACNIFKVLYEGNKSKMVWTGECNTLQLEYSRVQPRGSFYDLDAGVLHRSVLRSDFAITVLATTLGTPERTEPRVVGDMTRQEKLFDRAVTQQADVDFLMSRAVAALLEKRNSALATSIAVNFPVSKSMPGMEGG